MSFYEFQDRLIKDIDIKAENPFHELTARVGEIKARSYEIDKGESRLVFEFDGLGLLKKNKLI
jgi:hypothetical protein